MPHSPLVDQFDERILALASEIIGDWPDIIAVWEDFRSRNGYYLRADLEADRSEFLRQALWATYGQNHLRAFIGRLSENNLAGPNLSAVAEGIFGTSMVLQSYVNGRWQSQDAFAGGRRFLEACDHVCRISIDGSHRGTGVLIRPTVIATAAHVIASLVGVDRQALSGSLRRLSIAFAHADTLDPDNEVAPVEATEVQLHDQWLGYYSPRAHGEGEKTYPVDGIDGIVHDEGPWDFALIRIARPPRAGLKGYRPCEEDPPAARFGLHVLHHPADALGAPMRLLWSIGEVKEGLGQPRPLRWLHDANTDAGSSGAPCFDNAWRIVGLHQAGTRALSTSDQNNRAVPVYPWASRIDVLVADVETTPFLHHVGGTHEQPVLVLGRRELQASVWQAMSDARSDIQRTFLIMGDSGSGKSFTSKIVSELALRSGSRFATIDVRNSHGESGLAFARRIVGALGGSLLFPPEALHLSTGLRFVQNEVIPRLVQELEQIASGRSLWLVLDGLELCDAPSDGIGQLIEGLIAALQSAPHLHLVLLGWKSPLQAGFAEVLSATPKVDDLVFNLLQTLTPPGSAMEADIATTLRVLVEIALKRQTKGTPFEQAVAAVAATQTMVADVLGDIVPAGPAGTG